MNPTLQLTPALAGLIRGWEGPADLCREEEWGHGYVIRALREGRPVLARVGNETAFFAPENVRLDLSRPDVRYRIACWLAEGGGSGPTPRPCHDVFWSLPRGQGGTLPVLWSMQVLAWNAQSVSRGGGVIRGALLPWRHAPEDALWTWTRRRAGSTAACDYPVTIGDHGWSLGSTRGPETGDAGRACADAAALAHRFALATGGEDEPLILLPLPEEST